jgi:T5SS/PEP-CTERM-associated repeat protein
MRSFYKFCFAVLATASLVLPTRAEISAVGDTSPGPNAIDPLGYGITGQPGSISGDLVVGQTDLGGIFIDVAFGPGPLINDGNSILGEEASAYGAVSMDSFGADWLMGGNLTVGQAGIGVLDLFDSARVYVGNNNYDDSVNPPIDPVTDVVSATGLTTLGQLETGLGTVTLTGIASRLATADLIVGDLGVGNITMASRSAMYTADAYIGNGDGSSGFVSVSDLGTKWSVGNNDATTPTLAILRIGNIAGFTPAVGVGTYDDGTGQGIVRISNQGLVEVSDGVIVNRHGRLELETGGRLRMLPTVAPTNESILNNGLITGDGFIDFSGNDSASLAHEFVNGPTGQIRNYSNALESNPTGEFGANQRERLVITGNVGNGDLLINFGTIESYGGEMEFRVPVENNFEMVARDAIMRFPQGLTQNAGGILVLGGETTIHGPILPLPLAQIDILNDSIVTIQGDLIFTESFLVAALTDVDTGSSTSTLSMVVGDNASSLNVIGNVELGGATLSLDFVGSAPQVGDSFEILSAAGDTNGLGTFANDQINVDGKLWDIGYDADSVFVTYTGLSVGLDGDFDGDGDVDGRDLIVWQRNPSIGDLADWRANYGLSNVVPAVTAVPEPASAMLMLAGVLAMTFRRQK